MATIHITTDESENPILSGAPEEGWAVQVGDTLTIRAGKDAHLRNYKLWIKRGSPVPGKPDEPPNKPDVPPSDQYPLEGSLRVPCNNFLRCFIVHAGQTLRVRVIDERGTPGEDTIRFGLGVSFENEHRPRDHGGGSGSAGTLNVSPN